MGEAHPKREAPREKTIRIVLYYSLYSIFILGYHEELASEAYIACRLGNP